MAQHLASRPREAPPILRPSITCLQFKPWRSGSLVGYCDLHLVPYRMKLFACPAFHKGGRRWVSLPERVVIDRERQVTLAEDGKPRTTRVIEWDSTEIRNRWSDAAVDAVLAYDPGAFGREG